MPLPPLSNTPRQTGTIRPGRGRLTLLAARRWTGVLAFGAVFFLIGAAFAVMPWGMHARDSRIEREGVRVTAVITEREVSRDADGEVEHRIHYAFDVPGGARVQSWEFATQRAFQSVAEGDPLTVAYDPASPRDNYPIGNGPGLDGGVRSVWHAAAFSAFGLAFAAVGGLFLWGVLVRLPGRWSRLLRDGRTAQGIVTRIEANEGGSRTRLHYAYTDRFGVRHEGRTEWLPAPVTEGWAQDDLGHVHYGRRDAAESVWLGRGDLSFYR